MDPIALISRHILFPFYEFIRGVDSRDWWHYLLESQYFSPEQIYNNQWNSLRRILGYVYDHNSFYRERFNQIGATPDDVKSFSDFKRLPILTKMDIRHNLDSMISDGFNKSELTLRRTGGSTGEPIQAYWDKQSEMLKEVLVRRHDAWAHFLRGEKKAALWGNIKPLVSLRSKVSNALFWRTIFLDTLKMSESDILEFTERITKTRTKLLFGHAHSIHLFSKFLLNQNIMSLKFEGIISTAETLLSDERKTIEDIFGNVVFDRYGCEEIGLIASECEQHKGMHIASEGVYVEVVDIDKRGLGKIIVTDLINRGTPIIRYEIGDLCDSNVGMCTCGRGLPLLGRIIGRTSDILYTPEGKIVSGISFLDNGPFRIDGIVQVQVIQEKLDELTFNIVKDENLTEESLRSLESYVVQYFGQSMKHKVMFVDKIPLSARGKLQLAVCRLGDADIPF